MSMVAFNLNDVTNLGSTDCPRVIQVALSGKGKSVGDFMSRF